MTGPIALFGASGRTGRCVIDAAVGRGIGVRGLVRTVGALSGTGATEVAGSFDDDSAVDGTLHGASAACIVVGPHPPYTDVFCAQATEAVLTGMRRQGVTRVICQTGAMIGDYRGSRSLGFQLMTRLYQHRHPEPHGDRVRQESLVRDSGLDWTLVKPPRLTMRVPRHAPEVGPGVRVGLLSSVSRHTLGRFIVDELLEPEHARQVVFIRD